MGKKSQKAEKAEDKPVLEKETGEDLDSKQQEPIEEPVEVKQDKDEAKEEDLEEVKEDVGDSTKKDITEDTTTKKVENPLLLQLKEAFPNIEEQYVKAVIIASQGALDPAFNALLFLSDPESGKDIELPREPVQQNPSLPPRRKQTQLEQDEMLARQLDKEYNRKRRGERRHHNEREASRNYERYNNDDLEEDSWSQFVEKDLPEITARAKGSLQETATKVGTWFNGVKKNFIGEGEENDSAYYQDDSRGRDLDEDYGTYVEQQERRQRRGVQDPGYRRGDEQRLNARHRFNSFGASATDDVEGGISLRDEEFGEDEDEEVPPQLPSRARSNDSKKDSEEVKPQEGKKDKVVAETTYIDTPENKEKTKRKWQPLPPEPLNATPTKVNASTKKNKNESEDEFLINSDEEL
ncbi:Ubiquitin-binding protein CUE5 [Nakaseomyces glabratus]|nr:Ubiquitin-binding protein CUE5 [Nakaseomyces glabratus]KTB25401.1 Ubiquitin-binding protein CUE5 [Nakaseomyces glabratus]OXB41154.1 hypothetical protein B1J91_L09933g [Nakaseomyces glabratus]OXB46454.1 hypothetical protein B1J92_L09933g [Nakaseomyces glabratus]